MPFASERQRRYMFAQHPQIAHRWADEAKSEGTPLVDDSAYKKDRTESFKDGHHDGRK